MKRFYRILSAVLCMALLVPMLATTIFAADIIESRAVPTAPTELNSLSSYLHASVSTEDNRRLSGYFFRHVLVAGADQIVRIVGHC